MNMHISIDMDVTSYKHTNACSFKKISQLKKTGRRTGQLFHTKISE